MALLDSMPGENKAYTGAKGAAQNSHSASTGPCPSPAFQDGNDGGGASVGSVPVVFLIPGPQGLLEDASVEDLGDGLVMQVLALKREGRNSVPKTHVQVAGVGSVLVIPALGR